MQLHWNYCKRIFYAIKIYSKAHIINRIDMSITQNLKSLINVNLGEYVAFYQVYNYFNYNV